MTSAVDFVIDVDGHVELVAKDGSRHVVALEAVEAGIVTFDDEFAMHMVLPDGTRVAEYVAQAIDTAYLTGTVPPLLALGGAR